jgi:hypothetical protein
MSLKLTIKTKILNMYKDIDEFRKVCYPRINVKDDNGNLLADPQSVLNTWKIFFNRVLNVYGFVMLSKWMYIRLSH